MISTRPARAPGDPTRQLADHRRVLDEVSRSPILNATTITVELPNGVAVTTNHGLGRAFEQMLCSPPTGATATGRIVETSGDPSKNFILTATGHGATITVRVTLW